MAAKVIFTAVNKHSSECGEPPARKNDGDHQYCGYFENMYGEQWLFVYDKIQREGVLRGGDAGWDEEFDVKDGAISGNLILGAEERQWLTACWAAATSDG